MTESAFIGTVVTALITSVIGGGGAFKLMYRAHKDRLSEDLERKFSLRSELDGYGDRLNVLEKDHIRTKDRVDASMDRLSRVEERETHRWEPVLRFIERADKRIDSHQSAITRITTVLDQISRKLDT